ncbi:sensor domain-containing diguanylate cyclase [bacterium]|nr:sensor domain-containing diguanylate cyclase [bacterium]
MSAPKFRPQAPGLLNFHELCSELTQLDLYGGNRLGEQLVQTIGRVLGSDRVSLMLLDGQEPRLVGAFSTAVTLPLEQWRFPSELISHALTSPRGLLVHNLRETPQWLAPWSENYRTDACAIFPLRGSRGLHGVLCLGNLSAQQLMQMEHENIDFRLALQQATQLCQYLLASIAEPQRPAGTSADEISILARLVERMDQGLESRDAFTLFRDIVSDLIPVELLAVIHAQAAGGQRSLVNLARRLHRSELERAFEALAEQWQRRQRRAESVRLEDAELSGAELLISEEECSADLRLPGQEIFPIVLDNELFAVVLLSSTEETLANRRLIQFFNILVHQLLLHLKKAQLQAQNSQMETLDRLTGLYNQRHFYGLLDREFDRARRYNVALSLMIVDIDHFKDVNESYGPETGDLVLKELSRIIMENMRTTDFGSRYSGERFVVVLPETHNKNCELMASRLRRYIENYSFYIPNSSVFIKVTASIGVASYLEHKPASTAQFIELADSALYFAKLHGRNQVVNYSYVLNMMLGTTPNQG